MTFINLLKLFYFTIFILFISVNNISSQWIQTNGPYGAVADGVMSAGSYVVVRLDDFLGYKMTNGGQTWTSLSTRQ